jgi:hypothetical protein
VVPAIRSFGLFAVGWSTAGAKPKKFTTRSLRERSERVVKRFSFSVTLTNALAGKPAGASLS